MGVLMCKIDDGFEGSKAVESFEERQKKALSKLSFDTYGIRIRKVNPKNEMYVIVIGDRYFYRVGKKGQVMTACYLAGAKTYSLDALREDCRFLKAKGKAYDVRIVSLSISAVVKWGE